MFTEHGKPMLSKLVNSDLVNSYLNAVIMDYFISEGYPSAAQKFAVEANIQPRMDDESVQQRVEIRNAIYGGDIQSAIEKINELNPQIPKLFSYLHRVAMIRLCSCTTHIPFWDHDDEQTPTTSVFSLSYTLLQISLTAVDDVQVLSTNVLNKLLEQNSSLHFALLRLQLVELIRVCVADPTADIMPAIDFATAHLAPRAPTKPEFLEDLERTMALLIFPPDKMAPSLVSLLDPSLRKEVAKRVNEALLQGQNERTKAKIFDLVRLRAWSESKAREAERCIPEKISIGLDSAQNGQNGSQESGSQGNGEGEPMVT
ncbi:MAG: hypothetical protein Q9167_000544 [Letrouitia subvulpina]